MADLLESALTVLDTVQKAYVAQEVTYYRGASSVVVTATPATSEFEIVDVDGISHKIEMQDWLILKADLIIDSAVVEPLAGDQVRYVIGSDTFVFEVQEIEGEPAFKYTSPYKVRYRIHTKQIDVT